MALYEMTQNAFRALDEATFSDMNVKERGDIQRLLRTQIDVLGDDLYVLTEEFGDWEDSKRRIDLLAIDSQANLVVIELKRTADGGHMELQAIRYAAMVSAMTFDRAVSIHSAFLRALGKDHLQAESYILEFLGWEEPDEEAFGSDVRILLVSEGFGRELTTAVLWLRERDIDIRCVRLHPYSDNGSRLVDVQQIIPLPEANDYQVQLRAKGQASRTVRLARDTSRLKFWDGLLALAREHGTRHANIKPGPRSWLAAGTGVRKVSYYYTTKQHSSSVGLYIDFGSAEENQALLDSLEVHKSEIIRSVDREVNFEPLHGKRACFLTIPFSEGGYRSPETDWPSLHRAMVETMKRFESVIQPILDDLQL